MSLKTGSRWSNWAWDKPVKAFVWRSSRICRPIGGLPPWFFEDSLPHLLLRNNSIKTIYLDAHHQEQIRNRSFAMLKEPWALTEDEKMFAAPVMVPRPKTQTMDADFYTVNVSYRSKFGRQMRRQTAWGD